MKYSLFYISFYIFKKLVHAGVGGGGGRTIQAILYISTVLYFL